MVIVKVDERGRVVIPKEMRQAIGLEEGGQVNIKIEDERITVTPLEPVAESHYGAFKIERWPEDLDEYTTEALKNWWKQEST